MRVWITKYALTKGIVEVEAEVCSDTSTDLIKVGRYAFFHGEGREWHRTRVAAAEHAITMRTQKIAALKKQIAKLQMLTFEKDGKL